MLGVVTNPTLTASDQVMRAVAEEMGAGGTFHPTPVGVFFGGPGGGAGVEQDDPYFGGARPRPAGRLGCGGGVTRGRHNAKNTPVKNELDPAGAERAG